MSMFLPEGFDPTGGAGGSSSPADFGSPDPNTSTDDVALMQRVLAAAAQNPSLIPESFMGYLIDWLQISKLQIPIAQVPGYTKSVDAIISATLSGTQISSGTNSCSHTFAGSDPEVDTTGPTLAASVAGSYVLIASFKNSSNSPTDASHNELVLSTGLTCYSAQTANTSVAAIGFVILTAGQTITSVMKLCVGGAGGPITASMSSAQIVALRYA